MSSVIFYEWSMEILRERPSCKDFQSLFEAYRKERYRRMLKGNQQAGSLVPLRYYDRHPDPKYRLVKNRLALLLHEELINALASSP